MHRLISLPVLAIILAMSSTLHAQQYPSKPIRIIIPLLKSDYEKYGKLIRTIGLQPQ